MADELKPCPFCGGPGAVYQASEGVWHATCRVYQCSCYALLEGYATREEAVSEWNRRVSEIKPLRPCPFCGGKAKVYQSGVNVWRVMCKQLNCGTLACDWDTPEEAIAAWNRRNISEEELLAAMAAFKRRKCVDARDETQTMSPLRGGSAL